MPLPFIQSDSSSSVRYIVIIMHLSISSMLDCITFNVLCKAFSDWCLVRTLFSLLNWMNHLPPRIKCPSSYSSYYNFKLIISACISNPRESKLCWEFNLHYIYIYIWRNKQKFSVWLQRRRACSFFLFGRLFFTDFGLSFLSFSNKNRSAKNME